MIDILKMNIFKYAKVDEYYIKPVRKTILRLINKEPEKINELLSFLMEDIKNNEDIWRLLELLKTHDEYTFKHSVSVAVLSFFIGYSLNYSKEEMSTLIKGALLHDIGKSRIDLNILNKPSKLSHEEFDEVKKHSHNGYELAYSNMDKEILDIILYHHERLDGSGYPKGTRDNDTIFQKVRIVSVCDVFDALTSDRVYKKGMSCSSAYRIINEEMGKQLDMDLLDILIDNITLFDIGATVKLNTQEIATVVSYNEEDFSRPIVRVINGENEGNEIDLMKDSSYEIILNEY